MSRKRNIFIFSAFPLFGLLFTNITFALNQWIEIAPVTPTSLNNFITQSKLFAYAKKPTAKQTVQYSITANDSKHYSIYTMEPLASIGKVTPYKTTENIDDGSRFPGIPRGLKAIVHGKGLSLGGIFWPKETMTVYTPSGKVIYDNRIDITAIKPISGHLFPLKVGNELKFAFKRLHSRLYAGNQTVKKEIGVMTYKVIKKLNTFSFSSKKIPGPIYEIEVWESTNRHPKPYLTDIYKYSDGFHWYISDKYYTKENKLYAWYRVKNWH